MATTNTDRLLRLADVIGGDKPLVPLSNSGFYDAVRRGDLPKPKKIGRASVWSELELRAAMAALTTEVA